MEVSLAGRVALVTGASRGIGRAIALSLAEAGADIAVNYRRDGDAANETVVAIKALGRKARAYSASVENWDDDVGMVELVLARLRPHRHPGQQRRHRQPRPERRRHRPGRDGARGARPRLRPALPQQAGGAADARARAAATSS